MYLLLLKANYVTLKHARISQILAVVGQSGVFSPFYLLLVDNVLI
jgi:hypothetical protein